MRRFLTQLGNRWPVDGLLDWECSVLPVSAGPWFRRLPSDFMPRCVISGRAIASGKFAKK